VGLGWSEPTAMQLRFVDSGLQVPAVPGGGLSATSQVHWLHEAGWSVRFATSRAGHRPAGEGACRFLGPFTSELRPRRKASEKRQRGAIVGFGLARHE
jgi:hypothetical protein